MDAHDGVIVAAGDLGAVVRINAATWKAELWSSALGFVTAVAISPDGTRVALGIAASDGGAIEVREVETGAVLQTFPVSGSAASAGGNGNPNRLRWSPNGTQLVAVISISASGLDEEHIALIDLTTLQVNRFFLGAAVSIVVDFIEDSRLLVYVDRIDLAVLQLDTASGTNTLLATPSCSRPRSLSRVGADRFLLVSANEKWRLVDAQGATVSEGQACDAATACSGDVVASVYGTKVTITDLSTGATTNLKAKKRVDGMAFGLGRLLLGEADQLEVVELPMG